MNKIINKEYNLLKIFFTRRYYVECEQVLAIPKRSKRDLIKRNLISEIKLIKRKKIFYKNIVKYYLSFNKHLFVVQEIVLC